MRVSSPIQILFFFFNDTATTEIYTLSLHDALPICDGRVQGIPSFGHQSCDRLLAFSQRPAHLALRSEEHTSELQSLTNLVCRLLLEKKKNTQGVQTRNSIQRRSRRREKR